MSGEFITISLSRLLKFSKQDYIDPDAADADGWLTDLPDVKVSIEADMAAAELIDLEDANAAADRESCPSDPEADAPIVDLATAASATGHTMPHDYQVRDDGRTHRRLNSDSWRRNEQGRI